MTLPTWAPELDQVADYITSRTVDVNTPGQDTPTGTFSADTYPTSSQVQRIIDGACFWVSNATGALVTDLEEAATSVAAMRAAGLVELSYPERDADLVGIGSTLLSEASAALAQLVAANLAAGGVGVPVVAAPLGSFPDPSVWRADLPIRE